MSMLLTIHDGVVKGKLNRATIMKNISGYIKCFISKNVIIIYGYMNVSYSIIRSENQLQLNYNEQNKLIYTLNIVQGCCSQYRVIFLYFSFNISLKSVRTLQCYLLLILSFRIHS